MTDAIRYRGPDEEGIYQNDSLCMGMRRLSIIDLQGGSQPIYNEDGSVAVVYNGEIYNFKEIRSDLEEKGHCFSTNADTEVIVHAYEEYHTDAFGLFDGMFAIALYDSNTDELYLARDRMGEKPLYYYVTNTELIFGSELKCILSANVIEKSINKRALNQYMQLTYIPAPLTIFDNVFKIEAGHFISFSTKGQERDVAYWDIPIQFNEGLSYKDAVKRIERILNNAVSSRMVSDVPIGAFLSGGLDSASVVGTMCRHSKNQVNTFTIGSNEKGYDERKPARKIAMIHGTKHHEKIVDYGMFPKTFDVIIKNMDEPFADSSAIPTFILSEYIKNYVSVALTGDAGDELFAGYNKYLAEYYSFRYRNMPKVLRNMIRKFSSCRILCNSNLSRMMKKVILNADKSREDRHVSLMCMGVKESDIEAVMSEAYHDKDSLAFIRDYYNRHSSATPLQKALYTDLKVVLEGDMLVKVDRMSMLNSVETRIPLLSKEMIEFSMSLPDTYKMMGKKRKRILKDATKKELPLLYTKMKKRGFEIPISKWLKEDMRDEVDRVLNARAIEKQGIFNPEYVNKIKAEHFNGKENRRDELWTLFVFEKWFEKEFPDLALSYTQ
jgi:asparagine synthase (glutamine-hydrolysing)